MLGLDFEFERVRLRLAIFSIGRHFSLFQIEPRARDFVPFFKRAEVTQEGHSPETKRLSASFKQVFVSKQIFKHI